MHTLILLFLLTLTTVPHSKPDTEWSILNDGYIKIQYHDFDEEISLIVLSAIKSDFERIATMVGYSGPPIANVVISGSPEEFDGFTGSRLPGWSQASTDYERSVIVLKSPTFSSVTEKELRRTVIHELTHFIIGATTLPYEIPRWFNEGLAVQMSGEEKFRSKIAISRALFTNSLIRLNEVEEILTFESERANLAYAESRAAVAYLIETAGAGAVRLIIEKINSNQMFDTAFTEVTGVDLLEFEIEFRKDIKERYRYYFLAAANDYIWFLIPGLFILAYLAVKLKNRRIIRRWNVEDEEENGSII